MNSSNQCQRLLQQVLKFKLAFITVIALFAACADSGRNLQGANDTAIAPKDEDSIDTGVRPDIVFLQPQVLHQPMDITESCRAAEGLPDPWMEADSKQEDYPFQVIVESGISVQIGRNHEGLWIYASHPEVSWQHKQIEVQLTRVRLDESAWLQAKDVRTISWSRQGIFNKYGDDWQKIQDQRLARSWQSSEGVTIFLANILVDTALDSMFWGMELSLTEKDLESRKLGQWLFRGEAPVWPGLMSSQHCSFSTPDFQLTSLELWDQSVENPLNEKLLTQQLGLVRRAFLDASFALRTIRKMPMSVPIIVVPSEFMHDGGLKDKQSILWLDRELAAENNLQMRQEIRVYQQGLHFLTRRILRESLVRDDDLWLDIMAWAMTDRFLLDHNGLYEQVLSFHQDLLSLQNEEDEFSQRRKLAHLMAHHFSSTQLVAAWQKCHVSLDEDLQTCLLEEFFEVKQPLEMDGWLWPADTFHIDWQEELVWDEDGDGLINLLERRQGSEASSMDSDKDGWSDFAEYILQTDARSSVSHPPGLVIDGWFDDWIALYPHKVKANPSSKTSVCQNVELLYFSVFQAKNWLLMGAKLANSEPSVPIRWELSIDFTDMSHKILVQQDSGHYHTKVKLDPSKPEYEISLTRPFRNQAEDLELLLEDDWLKQQFQMSHQSPGEWLPQQSNMKISVYAMDKQGQWQYCEDTPWFAPVPVETSE
ncbi:MAG: hypothetical protein ACOH5I_05530 [Oligoflexus sp.]